MTELEQNICYHFNETRLTVANIAKQLEISIRKVSKCIKKYNLARPFIHAPPIDHTGKRYGKLIVIEVDVKKTEEYKTKNRSRYWFCKCDCGTVISVPTSHFLYGEQCKCRKCGDHRRKNYLGQKLKSGIVTDYFKKNGIAYYEVTCEVCGRKRTPRAQHVLKQYECKSCAMFKGVGDISLSYYSSIVYAAKVRDIEFNVTIEYLVDIYEKQNKLCALSNLPLVMCRSGHQRRDNHTASLDRIDNSKGYIEGNVQWIHKRINYIKHTLDQEDFIWFCNLISLKHPLVITEDDFNDRHIPVFQYGAQQTQ